MKHFFLALVMAFVLTGCNKEDPVQLTMYDVSLSNQTSDLNVTLSCGAYTKTLGPGETEKLGSFTDGSYQEYAIKAWYQNNPPIINAWSMVLIDYDKTCRVYWDGVSAYQFVWE